VLSSELRVFSQCRAYITRGELTTNPSNPSNGYFVCIWLRNCVARGDVVMACTSINEGSHNEIDSATIEGYREFASIHILLSGQ
jgi:hypothetical protein